MHLVDCQLGLFMFQSLAGCVGEAGEHLAFNRKSKGTIVLALEIPSVRSGAQLR